MEIINTIFYFLIVIGILVFIHEFGHFIVARWMGMRAEVFALGIGFRLFGYNKVKGFSFGKLKEEGELGDHTDYRVCAFPIGGYVKISGMIDESMDKEFIEKEPQPWEFRSKPVWRRMFVITAGVIMNILLAFIIFYVMTLAKGKSLTETTTIGYISSTSPAYESGLRAGDKIIIINTKEVKYWEDIQNRMYIDYLGESLTFVVERGDELRTIKIPKEKLGEAGDKNVLGIQPDNVIPYINGTLKDKPAEKVGLQKNDIVTSFNGIKIANSQQLTDMIRANSNKESTIEWKRDGKIMSAAVTPGVDSTIGIEILSKYEGPVKIITYNVISAAPKAAIDLYYYGFEVFVKSISKIIKGDIPFKKAIGGPVKIAQASAQSAEGGFFPFIGFLALLSMSLAVINILHQHCSQRYFINYFLCPQTRDYLMEIISL